MNTYKTAEVAAIIGIHPNTVRLYEKLKLIPKPKRLSNGYRVFTEFHIKQCKLIRLAFQIEVLQNGLRKKIAQMLMVSATGNFDTAITITGEYLKQIKQERRNAEEAIEIVEEIFSGATLSFEVMPVVIQKVISVFPLTQGIQLMKATFLGLPFDNALIPIIVMGAVTLICFSISVKCFKWE